MNCEEAIDLIGDAIDGRLPPESASGFEEHMIECTACGTYFQQLLLTREGLRALSPERVADRRREELLRAFRHRGAGK